jgi:hypothetical protein
VNDSYAQNFAAAFGRSFFDGFVEGLSLSRNIIEGRDARIEISADGEHWQPAIFGFNMSSWRADFPRHTSPRRAARRAHRRRMKRRGR